MGVGQSWESTIPKPCWEQPIFWILLFITILFFILKELAEPSINWENVKNYIGLYLMCGIVYTLLYYILGMIFNSFTGEK